MLFRVVDLNTEKMFQLLTLMVFFCKRKYTSEKLNIIHVKFPLLYNIWNLCVTECYIPPKRI